VVICAYTDQRWCDLLEAVASVRRQSTPVHETIVVIDSDQGLLTRATAGLAGARVVANRGPRGLSGARNTGWSEATGDVVAFLDDDARADEAWAGRLLVAYHDRSVVAVGGAVLPAWRTPRPNWFPEEFLWVLGCSYRGQPTRLSRVRNGIGANMSFRRDVLIETGGFRSSLGRLGSDAAGCEETELSIRVSAVRPRSRIMLEPRAVVHHAVTADRATRRYFRRRCLAEGRSKALVSELVGSGPALASERSHIRRVLTRGIAGGITELVRGDPAGGRRALAIIEGLALTVTGYVTRRARLRMRPSATGHPAIDPHHKRPIYSFLATNGGVECLSSTPTPPREDAAGDSSGDPSAATRTATRMLRNE
jgi:GT2 family glycosyltransferase